MKNLLTLLLLLISILAFAQQEDPSFVGSNKCKTCHRKAEIGDQNGVWLKGPHVSSMETLKTDAAAAIAKKMGLTTTADSAPECLVCHVTGWGTESGYQLSVDPTNKRAVKRNDDLARVGCESCHGAGSLYKSKKNMIGISDGAIKCDVVGLKPITEASCTGCHNPDSPTYKPFDYEIQVKEVFHPVPEK